MAAVLAPRGPSSLSEARPVDLGGQHTVSALNGSASGSCRTNTYGNSTMHQPFPSRRGDSSVGVAPAPATREMSHPLKTSAPLRSALPHHVRPRSETLPSAELIGRPPQNKSRVRAASTAEPPRPSRFPARTRLASLISTPSLAPAVLHNVRDETETLGSFTPTNPSGLSLRSLLRPLPPPTTRTSRHSAPDHDYDEASIRESLGSPLRHSPSPSDAPAIPSICRTPSSYTGSDYFPTAPSSAGPATPVRELSPSPIHRQKPLPLHPVLESLEDHSKFCVKTACANCHKMGNNFPCCPRCGEMWCSRECRLKSNGGRRHVCQKN